MPRASAAHAHPHPLAPAEVQARIAHALREFAKNEVTRVQIEVRGHTVILEGVVASWPEHQAIVRGVMGMPGVTAVDDRMLRWEL